MIVTVEYDCGTTIVQSTVLGETDTLLHNAKLGDQLIAQADALHDTSCETCSV